MGPLVVALGGRLLHVPEHLASDAGAVLTVTRSANLPAPLRSTSVYLSSSEDVPYPDGFRLLMGLPSLTPPRRDVLIAPDTLSYLRDGDVVKISPKMKSVRVLFRKSSPHNFFLVTERCNHYCLMCSQPPKEHNDDWLLDDLFQAVPLIDRKTQRVGITGGEPTLLGRRFIELISRLRAYLPETAVHVLTNGRSFSSPSFVDEIASLKHPNLTFAIPIYSDVPSQHDYIVQADDAFGETIKGILALKERGQRVELRVVLHRLSIGRLRKLVEFIYRNLTFVDHVALMGLEVTGFAKANLEKLWIDPWDYRAVLSDSALYLDRLGMNVSIFNHQLCTLEPAVWGLARKSISDWKNQYLPACESCHVREQCGGFFATSTLRRSTHIKPPQKDGA